MTSATPASGLVPSSAQRPRRIAILGVGLIGGSVAAALRAGHGDVSIAGFAAGGDAERALEIGLIDEACRTAAAAVADADWVILAAPVTALPQLMADCSGALAARARLTDCGSTKRSVVAAAREMLGAAFDRFIPGHPIAGSERSGPDAASRDLFRGRRWILCPLNEAQRGHCADLRALLAPTGALISEMTPEQHDRLFAEVSHWPHAVAFALGAAIGRGGLADAAIEFSGGGLRDTSRIAASSPELWAGILLDNAEAVLESADRYQAEIDSIKRALREQDRGTLLQILSQSSRWRSRLG